MRALVGAHRERLRERIHALYGATLAGPLAKGTVDVAREDGAILGAAVWHAPDEAGTSLRHLLPHVGANLRTFGFPGVLRALRIHSAVKKYHPAAPHWYLQGIGVNERARGRGVGSTLLDHRLALVDARGEASYLESANSRTGKLYRTRGFNVTRRIDAWPDAAPDGADGADGADAAPYGMWRPSRLAGPGEV